MSAEAPAVDRAVDRLIDEAVKAASVKLERSVWASHVVQSFAREHPELDLEAWLDALFSTFGPEAMQAALGKDAMKHFAATGEAADRLIVDAYDRFMALGDPRLRGRGRDSEQYLGDPDFNQKAFIRRFALELIGEPVTEQMVWERSTEYERAKKKLRDLRKRYSKNSQGT